MAKKPSIGRQKIKIAKIQVKNHLQVTFSKRRSGLFKKASELSTLCGVDIAIIVFSPAGKVFSFGHPNVEYIIDRFSSTTALNSPSAPNISVPFSLAQAQRNASVRELNLQLGQVLNEVESERKRGEALDDHAKKSNENKGCWWEGPVEKMELREVEQLRIAMEELRKNVAQQEMKFAEVMMSKSNNMVFGTGGVFDQYETKPTTTQLIVGDHSTINGVPVNANFGYGHGYF